MGAMVSLNGVSLIPQNITDQFLRYILPLPQHALERGESFSNNSSSDSVVDKLHTLTVTFDPSIVTNGRFMACSGGWDWAPYSRAGDERGSRIFSLGLVQPLYIVPVHQAYVTRVVPKIYYTGKFPRWPLSNQEFDDFVVHVQVTVQFVNHDDDKIDSSSSSSSNDYVLLAQSDFTSGITTIPIHRTTQTEKNQVDVLVNWTVSKDKVDLWWPNGMGEQPLYKLQVAIAWNATITAASTNGDVDNQQHQSIWMERRIGFRTLALVTVNDTNDDIVDNLLHKNNPPQEGTGEHGMYIRINGAVVSSRGANVIPMDQLEGRWSNMGHKRMVEAAAKMGMNMLRIWGGGAVLPRAFYDACDEHGILLYHDLMFVQEQNHGAPPLPLLTLIHDEVEHIVQKLSHHVSIVLYAGCNECLMFGGTIDAYELLLQTLAQVDDTRALWPVSPSRAGWKTGVHTLDGRPILGGTLKANRDDDYAKHALEGHGPYGHGVSLHFPTVNQVPSEANYTANIPPILSSQPTGIMYPNTFVSEFGASVYSSFESMSVTLPREAWSIHGNHGGTTSPTTCQQDYGQVYVCNGTNVMTERNYACDSHIEAFFGVSQNNSDAIGAQSFQRQLYLCMISQTLWMKSQIETMRSQNSFGLLLWQLNENWPTGGWGVIEYGPQPGMTGQVFGGRWKPLAYLLRDVLYRPVFAACGENVCYMRNDSIYPFDVVLKIEAWSLLDNKMVATHNHKVHLNAGPGLTLQFRLPHLVVDHADMALIRVENDQSGDLLMKNSVFLWQPPKSLPALSLPVQFVHDVRARDKRSEHATIRLHSNRVALYVVLSTEVKGHFSDNVFHLRPNQVVEVDFEASDGDTVNVDVLRRTLRIEHLGSYHSSCSGLVDNFIDDQQRPSQWSPSLSRLFLDTIMDAKIFLGLRMF